MVLKDVANGAGLIVERATALNSKMFRHGDLHTLDIVAVPESFHKRVRKTKHDHVVHGPLTQIMIDAKHRPFSEVLKYDFIQALCGWQVMTKWFLDDDSGPPGAAGIH